jgi:hypothetical protein
MIVNNTTNENIRVLENVDLNFFLLVVFPEKWYVLKLFIIARIRIIFKASFIDYHMGKQHIQLLR